MQDTALKYGAVVSSNGNKSIVVNEVFDHYYVPDYPATAEGGIAHFVHFQKPLLQEGGTQAEHNAVFTRLMSRVCTTYPSYMLSIC